MTRKLFFILLSLVAVASVVVYYLTRPRAQGMVLTGIVDTDDVMVSSQVSGRLSKLLVQEGDTVSAGQLLAVIQPEELRATQQYYLHSEQSSAELVQEARAALKLQELQTRDQIRQAEANVATAEAQEKQAAANRNQARLNFNRSHGLFKQGIASAQEDDQARTALQSAEAQLEAARKQVLAQRAALALARSNAEQVAMREKALAATRRQLAAAKAQNQVAKVRVGYTEIRSPIAGLVALRAALEGEVVNPAQPIVVLYNPDKLWVRADVAETYIHLIRIGERLPVRFPGGFERTGTVYFRGVDAEYATQRDVSRTKRDIKTFQIRLRVDNRDRRLAPGLTAYVSVPFKEGS